MAIGAILQATSYGVPHMIVGRIVWYVYRGLSLSLSTVQFTNKTV